MFTIKRKIVLCQMCCCLTILCLTLFLLFYYNQEFKTEKNDEFPFSTDFSHLRKNESLNYLAAEPAYLNHLREKLHCLDKSADFVIDRRGKFWILKNYIKPVNKKVFKCYETITYTTHVDFTFLDNLEPLVERWLAPVSVAVYSPGSDYQKCLESVIYVRKCLNNSNLIRELVSFHFFFEHDFISSDIVRNVNAIESVFQCVVDPPYKTYGRNALFKTQKNLTYPINVARNIAREAAQTYFVLASDIELYPNPGLAQSFLEMYSKRSIFKHNEVFVLPIFEVEKSMQVPLNKQELQKFLKLKKAIPFHSNICLACHSVPKQKEWIKAQSPSEMRIHTSTKRQGNFGLWEPIYIGTNKEPWYEESLDWEGKSDKMTQGYTLCLLDYDFHVLSEGFLVHKPGIKTKKEATREKEELLTKNKLKKDIIPQIELLFGKKTGCIAFWNSK